MIFTGDLHTFILNDKNEIFASGSNYFGQLGLGDNENHNQFTKIDAYFLNKIDIYPNCPLFSQEEIFIDL